MDKSKTAIDVFNKRALHYQEKYMDVSLYADALDTFCKQLPVNAKVLELACGPGNITKYLLNKSPDLRILATDLAPNMLELAKASNPTVEVQLLDSREIKTLQQSFDGIMCGFCLPYLSKEEVMQLIKDAAEILSANGVLYLSTMEGDYNTSAWQRSSQGDEIFVCLHEADYLIQALHKAGFAQVEVTRKITGEAPPFTTDLLLLASK